jgi:hypothetical protein
VKENESKNQRSMERTLGTRIGLFLWPSHWILSVCIDSSSHEMSKMLKQIFVIALIILVGIGIYEAVLPMMGDLVTQYTYFYDSMSKPDYLIKLLDYIDNTLRDPIGGLNYTQLLTWEHRHLEYIPTNVTFLRRNMPIDILSKTVQANGKAMGRCGEFALLYTGLCMANRLQVKLIVDESSFINKSKSAAGDHVWNEVWDNSFVFWIQGTTFTGKWVHVDPTEQRINDPQMYVRDWNKDVNLVYAIWYNGKHDTVVKDVTEEYF